MKKKKFPIDIRCHENSASAANGILEENREAFNNEKSNFAGLHACKHTHTHACTPIMLPGDDTSGIPGSAPSSLANA